MQTMENKELRAFLLVLRQALLMVTAYIEKHYIAGENGTTHGIDAGSSVTPVVPTKTKSYSMRVQ